MEDDARFYFAPRCRCLYTDYKNKKKNMKLRNKKTGEVYYMYSEAVNLGSKPQIILFPRGQVQPDKKAYCYDSLSELNEDWEDYDK